MSVAKVGSLYQGSSDTNGFTTSALATSGATCLVVAVADDVGSPASTLTDSAGNTYGAATLTRTTTYTRLQVWVITAPATGGSHTWTIAGGCYAPSIAVLALSGVSGTSTVDVSSSAADTATNDVQPGSITPSRNHEAVVTIYGSSDTAASVSAPFSPADGATTGTGNHRAISMAYDFQTTATARNPTWGVGYVAPKAAAIIALRSTTATFDNAPACASASGSSSSAATATVNSTGAKLLILDVAYYHPGGAPDASHITESGGSGSPNTWVALTNRTDSVERAIRRFYCLNPTYTGASHVIGVSKAGIYPGVSVMAVDADGTVAHDQENYAARTSGSDVKGGSITPPQANCLMVTGVGQGTAKTWSIDSGYTIGSQASATARLGSAIAYEIQTTATARNPNWTTSLNADCTPGIHDSFTVTAAGGGGGGSRRRVVTGLIG